jgi:hypothetical protein
MIIESLSGQFGTERSIFMKRFPAFSNVRLVLEVLLLMVMLAVLLANSVVTRAASSQAPNAQYWYVCNAPNHVAVFMDRVHIFCTTTTTVAGAPALDPAILWFTVPTSPDSAAASRFMSLFQTSVITARPIWVFVDPVDTSGVAFGCGASNCRRIYGMEMR